MSCAQNERRKEHKTTQFDFVHPFAFENRFSLKLCFRIWSKLFNSVTLKMGGVLEFSLQLGNNEPQHSDFVCKAYNGT